MLNSRKGEESIALSEESSHQRLQGRLTLNRPRRSTFGYQPHNYLQNKHAAISNPPSDIPVDSFDKKLLKTIPKKMPMSSGVGNRMRGRVSGKTGPNTLNKYRFLIRRFLQGIEEYKKLEDNLRSTHDNLIVMRKEILESTTLEPGEVPEVQSSIQDMIRGLHDNKLAEQEMLELGLSEMREAFLTLEEEKKCLEEKVGTISKVLQTKEQELLQVQQNGRIVFRSLTAAGQGDADEVQNLKKLINELSRENEELNEKLHKRPSGEHAESSDEEKIRSLEKLVENLHVEMKKLKDQLKIEKEGKNKFLAENERLEAEIKNLKELASSTDSKYIILEKDSKIQDLQNRLKEISRVRAHQSPGNSEVFKVDFSADTSSLVTQLARFVQLYEEVAREGFDLEAKLKEAHMEIYRLEEILEKQLAKIKEQDTCLRSMEASLNTAVTESRKNSKCRDVDREVSICKCGQYQDLIKEKEEFSEKLKEKMSLLYQKYKQYKSECSLMKKKLDAFEKKSWLKKLVNI